MDTPNDPSPSLPPSEPTPTPTPAPATAVATGSPSAEEKQWAMFCHLAGLVGLLVAGIGQIIGPLVMWLIKKDTMPYVNQEGKEALNFQISVTIYLAIAALSIYACIGLVLFPAVVIFDIIVTIMACIDASNGKGYRYPLCIRFIQ